jgi:murein DD-endopeptidase MepM/ murein hydrolase activator NlpD
MRPPTRSRHPRLRRFAFIVAALLIAVLLIPERAVIPVAGASARDWNPRSFWFAPWGRSGVHKGIDIFAPRGRPVVAATAGVVLFRGEIADGGTVIAVLGPKWRVHYYAHLDTLAPDARGWVSTGTPLGTVGDSGNARGKPPHLHYSVLSLLPLPWRYTPGIQGWRRMFYLDPGAGLTRDD